MLEYRYLTPENIEDAVDIHIAGQPGTVLTLLGRHFLIELYKATLYSRWGESFGVFDDGKLVAQAAMALSSERFFSEVKWKYMWRAAPAVALSIIKTPKLLSYLRQSWRYADLTRSPDGECDVIFLGVKKEYMRHGIGPDLVHHLFGWANLHGAKTANFMVDKRNRAVRWLVSHQLNGFYLAHEFEAYGRTMMFYKVPIAENLEKAQMPQGQPVVPTHTYSEKENGESAWR
jgi:ribosomal protein S18 acetylase RimI-like enzyme